MVLHRPATFEVQLMPEGYRFDTYRSFGAKMSILALDKYAVRMTGKLPEFIELLLL